MAARAAHPGEQVVLVVQGLDEPEAETLAAVNGPEEGLASQQIRALAAQALDLAAHKKKTPPPAFATYHAPLRR